MGRNTCTRYLRHLPRIRFSELLLRSDLPEGCCTGDYSGRGRWTSSRTTFAGNCKRRWIACTRKMRLTVLGLVTWLLLLLLLLSFRVGRKLTRTIRERRVPSEWWDWMDIVVKLRRLHAIILLRNFVRPMRLLWAENFFLYIQHINMLYLIFISS